MSSHLVEKICSEKNGCSKGTVKENNEYAGNVLGGKGHPGEKNGCSKGTVKENNEYAGNVVGEKGNPGEKNGCSKGTVKENVSVANYLVSNPPSEPPKGSRIKPPK